MTLTEGARPEQTRKRLQALANVLELEGKIRTA
jgi:hypothetical protein